MTARVHGNNADDDAVVFVFDVKTLCNSGKQYANVFPDPVLALTNKSRPSMMANGKHFDCTSVGRTCPILDNAFRSLTSIPHFVLKETNVSSSTLSSLSLSMLALSLALPSSSSSLLLLLSYFDDDTIFSRAVLLAVPSKI
jgi:hypothetical protein